MSSVLISDGEQRMLPLRHERQLDQVPLRGNGKLEPEAEERAGIGCVRKVSVFRQRLRAVGGFRGSIATAQRWPALRVHSDRKRKKQKNEPERDDRNAVERAMKGCRKAGHPGHLPPRIEARGREGSWRHHSIPTRIHAEAKAPAGTGCFRRGGRGGWV